MVIKYKERLLLADYIDRTIWLE